MNKYKCTVCEWIYDPEVGDPDGGIAPGTPFEKIPDDWQCPMCGAAKSEFENSRINRAYIVKYKVKREDEYGTQAA